MSFNKIPFLALCLIFSSILFGQKLDYQKGKPYTIDSIAVKGLKSFSPETVISYSGLRKGVVVVLPGETLTQAIKKLWELKLFSKVNIYLNNIIDDKIYLTIEIQELPTVKEFKIIGVSEKHQREISKDVGLKVGLKITQNFITNTKNYILKRFIEKGFFNVKTQINITESKDDDNMLTVIIRIDRGKRVKVESITIKGNKYVSDKVNRSKMKNTKQKFLFRLKRSKYIKEDYEEDKLSIIEAYKEKGYRDARIVKDTIIKNDNNTIGIDITVNEGEKYFFGDISFIGNSMFTDRQLSKILGISKGEVYNGVLLKKKISDNSKPDANDLTNLYQNSGYLFSTINPVEKSIDNKNINYEIRIIEGKRAHYNHVSAIGNDRTNDHVIYRELRTRPGELYSKENVIRTVRELSQLRFFDAEQLVPNFKNADPNAGLIDLEYSLVEKGSSQIELQGGYGGGGFIGTLGLAFNNFSMKGIFDKNEYRPIPLGDGQNFALRFQASQFYENYSISFSEPWWGGKAPISFSVSLSHTNQYLYDPLSFSVDRSRRFLITGITIGSAKRLKFPDDYFVLSQSLSFKHYNLQNYTTRLFTFGDGYANSIAYTIALSRNSSGPNPIYPLMGSNFSLSLKLAPPYSLFSGTDYANLENMEEYKDKDSQGFYLDEDGNRTDNFEDARADQKKIDQEKFKILEFYKLKFKADWYNAVIGKLVLKTTAEFGILGSYNDDIGLIPFERFFVGGTGLVITSLDGRENIQVRGYPNQSLSNQDGTAIYNKFNFELRYPVTLKPSASIYGLVFGEGARAFDDVSELTPFQLKKSAGLGIRVFLPAFGLIGFDFGYGFDPILDTGNPSGWNTHFIIGQQF